MPVQTESCYLPGSVRVPLANQHMLEGEGSDESVEASPALAAPESVLAAELGLLAAGCLEGRGEAALLSSLFLAERPAALLSSLFLAEGPAALPSSLVAGSPQPCLRAAVKVSALHCSGAAA